MTKKRYLDMMEQLGQEPKMEEMPPDYEDFPDIVIDAIETFNSLGDRIFGDVGYTGKDYTNLPVMLGEETKLEVQALGEICRRLPA